MGMSKETLDEVSSAFIESFKKDWNLDSNLRKLIWNDDYACDQDGAKKFLLEDLD
jgi:hypothetical protein